MEEDVTCPKCKSEQCYQEGMFWNCPECGKEWNQEQQAAAKTAAADDSAVRDAYGNILQTGDSVSVIKDLKVKGSSSSIKGGTKVKNIRLVPDGPDGDNIARKIDGLGSMNLKSEFVKKS